MKKLLEIPETDRTQRNLYQIKIGKRARDRMMEANLRLVVSVAKKFQNQGLFLSELVQAGLIGLEIAVDTFYLKMGYRFYSFAYWCIQSGIIKEIDAYKESIPNYDQNNKIKKDFNSENAGLVPPHNVQAEEEVLGGILLDPRQLAEL